MNPTHRPSCLTQRPRIYSLAEFLVFVLAFCTSSVFAAYSLDKTSTTNGNSYWSNSILTMTASLNGSNITFMVSKSGGGSFSSSGTMYLKVGTYESYGENRGSKSVTANSTTSLSFTHDLNTYSGYPKDFYARYQGPNSTWAWVGPIKVSILKPLAPNAPSASATGTNSINLSWSTVSNATIYGLWRAESATGTYKQIYCAASPSYTDSGTHLLPATTYYYKVKAGNSEASCSDGASGGTTGWSDFSGIGSATTQAKAPTGPSVEWRKPVEGSQQYGLMVPVEAVVNNDLGIQEVFVLMKDKTGNVKKEDRFFYRWHAETLSTEVMITVNPMAAGFTEKSAVTVSFKVTDKNAQKTEIPSSRTFNWCEKEPCADTALPTGRISGINSTYTVGETVSYQVQGQDNEALLKLSFTVTDANNVQKYTRSWDVSGTSANYSESFPTTGWGAGTYYYALWVKDKAGNAKEEKGLFALSNPPPATNNTYNYDEVKNEILRLAKEKNIPPIVIQAIAFRESGWDHFDKNNEAKINSEPDGREGIGIMQVTECPPNKQCDGYTSISQEEYDRLKNDWRYNLEKGVEKLDAKWQKQVGFDKSLTQADKNIVENWYYPVMWYNGDNENAVTYVCNAFSSMSNPPEKLKMYWDKVDNVQDPTNILTMLKTDGKGEAYTIPGIIDKGVVVHYWHSESGQYSNLSKEQYADLSETGNNSPESCDVKEVPVNTTEPDITSKGYNEPINPFIFYTEDGKRSYQCTTYAFGRVYEKTGKELTFSQTGGRHGGKWYDLVLGVKGSKSNLPRGTEPRSNSLVMWSGGDYGHVAFVEKVEGEKIIISEANWWKADKYNGFYEFNTNNIKVRDDGKYKLVGYIYLDTLIDVPTYITTLDKEKGEIQIKGLSPVQGETPTVKVDGREVSISEKPTCEGIKLNTGVPLSNFGDQPFHLVVSNGKGEVMLDTYYPFMDAKPEQWYTKPAIQLWKLNILEGKDGVFGQGQPTLRAEFLKMVLEAASSSEALENPDFSEKGTGFSDLKDHWVSGYVHYAEENDIVSVGNKLLFRPNEPITRAEAAKMISKTFKWVPDESKMGMECLITKFTDLSGNEWYYDFIADVCKHGIMKGTVDKYGKPIFNPTGALTREEAAMTICRAYSYQKQNNTDLCE